MFIVTLKFIDKEKAPPLMNAHSEWLRSGFEDGIFFLAGSLRPPAGGAILANAIEREALEKRVREDPFVAEGIVNAEILEIAPARTDERLAFLKE